MKYFILTSLFCLFLTLITAQTGATFPISTQPSFQRTYNEKALPAPKEIVVDELAFQEYQSAYESTVINSFPIAQNLPLSNFGQWYNLPDSSRLWIGRIALSAAGGMAVFLDKIEIPKGGHIVFYNRETRQIQGPFTANDFIDKDRIWSGVFVGNEIQIELYEPKNGKGKGALNVFRVDQMFTASANNRNFGNALSCHENVNCPIGADWQTEKAGICRIDMVLAEGIGFCTGNLLNNTAADQTPYILTGFHCQDGFTPLYDLWFFDFNYEAAGCDQPAIAPSYVTLPGCVQRAGRQESDMLLLELKSSLPDHFGTYFLGWNRAMTTPGSGGNIHHPVGDIKKITTFNGGMAIQPSPITWNNEVTTPTNHHFRVEYSSGAFELGSSGSALLDANKRVVGQLHGGVSDCNETIGFYGRFALSWEGGGTKETRLKDWLDPLGTNALVLDGLEKTGAATGIIAGTFRTIEGNPIPGVTVQLAGDLIYSSITNEEGVFNFAEVPFNETYNIDVTYEDDYQNGVSIIDVIQLRKHIQNVETLDNPYKMIVADVNASGSLTVSDIIKIQKLILNIETSLEDVPVWRFLPSAFEFENTEKPFDSTIPNQFVVEGYSQNISNLNFIGIKYGDLNASASMDN